MTTPTSPLSTRRAFVLHLGAAADPGCGVLEGRVEHVQTGRVLRFRSTDELLAFLAETHAAADPLAASDNPGAAGAPNPGRRA